MTKDITFTYNKAWNKATTEDDNNYEAIGGVYEPNDYYFQGDFDGAGHTISGIRIHRSGTADADCYQGIFGQTKGANIHGLHLANARITGHNLTGGIVGDNNGTVTDCHVANEVCIHAANAYAYHHGGIAGRNYSGTVENCTSAATLTIPSGTSGCQNYGTIAGHNGGTLSNNLAIGATVPTAASYTHGAIVGLNERGTLQRNYYTACKVACENVTPSGKGCENADVADENASKDKTVGETDVKAGEFVRAKDGAAVPVLRAYLTYSGDNTALQARAMNRAAGDALPQTIIVRLLGKDGSVTAIGSLATDTGELNFGTDDWYTLGGRKLGGKPATRGIYIHKGKKVVIK